MNYKFRETMLFLSGGFLTAVLFVIFLLWFFSGGELKLQWDDRLALMLGIPAIIFAITLLAKDKSH